MKNTKVKSILDMDQNVLQNTVKVFESDGSCNQSKVLAILSLIRLNIYF